MMKTVLYPIILLFSSNVSQLCYAQEEASTSSTTISAMEMDDFDSSYMASIDNFEDFGDIQIAATRKKHSKHRKNRAKEEIMKAKVNACEPDYLLYDGSPETWYTCLWPVCECEYPYTDEGYTSCTMPNIPKCEGDDRYFYKPPIDWIPSFMFGSPFLKMGLDWFLGPNAQAACRLHCSGYQDQWCPAFGGMPYCVTSSEDCTQLNWDQYTAVGGFISNFIPATKVLKIMKNAKKVAKSSRAAWISTSLRTLAKNQVKSLGKKAIRNLKREIKGIAEDLKDDLIDVAMEEMLLEEAEREAEVGFDWDDAEDILRAVDVIGIYDLTDSFWKQECSVFEPEDITEGDSSECADTAAARRSGMRIDNYWNDHYWNELCSQSKSHFRRLGWNERKWEGLSHDYPRSSYQNWKDLSSTQRNAAEKLGYNQFEWNVSNVSSRSMQQDEL